MTETSPLWSYPVAVEDVAEAGSHFSLVAEGPSREAVARAAGLRDLTELRAEFDVIRRASGYRVIGEVRATVGQTCVVSLEPIENKVMEPIELLFADVPEASPSTGAAEDGDEEGGDALDFANDPPEPLVDGKIDLGAVAVEFLMLGIDPYPRKAGVAFEAPAKNDEISNPFAALRNLKPGSSDSDH